MTLHIFSPPVNAVEVPLLNQAVKIEAPVSGLIAVLLTATAAANVWAF